MPRSEAWDCEGQPGVSRVGAGRIRGGDELTCVYQSNWSGDVMSVSIVVPLLTLKFLRSASSSFLGKKDICAREVSMRNSGATRGTTNVVALSADDVGQGAEVWLFKSQLISVKPIQGRAHGL